MQIVIGIDDNLYTRLFDNGIDDFSDIADVLKAVRKGTPLPQGHGRLIDADVLHKDFEDRCMSWEAQLIDYAQTIIEKDGDEE